VEEETFTSFRCPDCGGVSHPASGCQYSERTVVCGRCTRRVFSWVRVFTASKGARCGRPAFYDHVGRVSA